MAGMAIRTYADTSVFGGVADREFAAPRRRLFARVRAGRLALVVSTLVVEEPLDSPRPVRDFYGAMADMAEVVPLSAAALELRDAYLHARIVAETSAADALHVALATVAECPLVVSWNFKHIVNFRRIPLYNAVNRARGYGEVGIYTPQEVVEDGEEGL